LASQEKVIFEYPVGQVAVGTPLISKWELQKYIASADVEAASAGITSDGNFESAHSATMLFSALFVSVDDTAWNQATRFDLIW